MTPTGFACEAIISGSSREEVWEDANSAPGCRSSLGFISWAVSGDRRVGVRALSDQSRRPTDSALMRETNTVFLELTDIPMHARRPLILVDHKAPRREISSTRVVTTGIYNDELQNTLDRLENSSPDSWSPIDRDIYDDEFGDIMDGLIREGEAAG